MGIFLASHWRDLIDLIGFALGLISLGFAIWASLSAKSAARQAREAAQQVKTRIFKLDAVAAISSAILILEEIKVLHRSRLWDQILSRHASLRGYSVAIRAGLKRTQREEVGRVFSQLRIIEEEVEQGVANQMTDHIDVAKCSRVASTQIEALQKILVAIVQAED